MVECLSLKFTDFFNFSYFVNKTPQPFSGLRTSLTSPKLLTLFLRCNPILVQLCRKGDSPGGQEFVVVDLELVFEVEKPKLYNSFVLSPVGMTNTQTNMIKRKKGLIN